MEELSQRQEWESPPDCRWLCRARAPPGPQLSWESSLVRVKKFGHSSKTQTQFQSCFSEQNKLNWQMQFKLVLHISATYFASREMWQIEASIFFKNSTTNRAWQSLVQNWCEMPIALASGVLREGLKQTSDLSWTHW